MQLSNSKAIVVGFLFCFAPLVQAQKTGSAHYTSEQIAYKIDAYDNYGMLETHAFNGNIGVLVCVYSTGEVKSYDLKTKVWTTVTKLENYSGFNAAPDISDDGYILLNLDKPLLVNVETGKTDTLPTEVQSAVFLRGQKNIAAIVKRQYMHVNAIEFYAYPQCRHIATQGIDWERKPKADSAYFVSIHTKNNILSMEVCLNPFLKFNTDDSLHTDSIWQCNDMKQMEVNALTMKAEKELANGANEYSLTGMQQYKNLLLGDVSPNAQNRVYSSNSGLLETSLKDSSISSFGAIDSTITRNTFYEGSPTETVENTWDQYTGLYYTKEGNILSVQRNGGVYLWKK